MGRERRLRKIRQQINYKSHSKSGKDTRRYDIVPRTRKLFRRLLIKGKRVTTEVGVANTGQRVCTGPRSLYRRMKQVDRELRHVG